MKLKFFRADDFDSNLKASIHSTGKLGFTETAIKKFEINTEKGVLLAQEEEDKTGNLYLKITNAAEPGAFKFSKAGAYYYINARLFFDTLGYDYKAKSIKFDIMTSEYEGEPIYKLVKNEKERKENQEEQEE